MPLYEFLGLHGVTRGSEGTEKIMMAVTEQRKGEEEEVRSRKRTKEIGVGPNTQKTNGSIKCQIWAVWCHMETLF